MIILFHQLVTNHMNITNFNYLEALLTLLTWIQKTKWVIKQTCKIFKLQMHQIWKMSQAHATFTKTIEHLLL